MSEHALSQLFRDLDAGHIRPPVFPGSGHQCPGKSCRRCWPYVLQVYHGPQPCPKAKRGCRAAPGDLLVETVHSSLSSVQVEVLAATAMVDDPRSHAARFAASGPDYYVEHSRERL